MIDCFLLVCCLLWFGHLLHGCFSIDCFLGSERRSDRSARMKYNPKKKKRKRKREEEEEEEEEEEYRREEKRREGRLERKRRFFKVLKVD